MSDVRSTLEAGETWLNSRFTRREDAVEALKFAAVTGFNTLLGGDPGTGKSALLRDLARIIDGRLFVRQMHQFITENDVNGPLDPAALRAGDYLRNVTGFYPEADLAMFDEVDKTGPAVFGIMLTAWNERVFSNGGAEVELPTLFNVGSFNAKLDDPTGAVWDRWPLRVMVEYLPDGSDFMRMLMTDFDADDEPPATTTPDDIRQAQVEARGVTFSPDTAQAMADLRSSLRAAGVIASDRRWMQAKRLAKASAWLEGRDETAIADLAPLQHLLWIAPEQRAEVTKAVLAVAAPFQAEVVKIQAEIDSLLAQMHGTVMARSDKVKFVMTAGATLQDADRKLTGIIGSSAGRTKRDAEALLKRIPEIHQQMKVDAGLAWEPSAR